jgi:predicted glycogen debranching enzyme
LPAITAYSNASYQHQPTWYRHFFYQEEWLRGFDAIEDLASPGIFSFDLKAEAVLIFAATGDSPVRLPGSSPDECLQLLRRSESQRRRAFATPRHRAADQYIVRRGSGKSIIAGYPWFGDWGRDTFISLRGLCLAAGRLEEARQILLAWAPYLSDGMLPNRFPDHGEAPEYNTVDAALWYVIAIDALFTAAEASPDYFLPESTRKTLLGAIGSILAGYSTGTRHGIRCDDDGQLRCGEPGVQLTWMDARVGERVITPRMGKPVEIQALWINALHIASAHQPKWQTACDLARASFLRRFWIDSADALYDVIDVDHQPGCCDASFRPNQIFAVGGLPLNLLGEDRAFRLVAHVEKRLWTPLGLRSLEPTDPEYAGRYCGSPSERDAVYHQGTVWPWLAGAFIEAWVRARNSTNAAKLEARRRFLGPLLNHVSEAGVGHVSEIADGDQPHMPRGCPFQAWSLAELLRVDREVLHMDPVKPQRRDPHPTAAALSRS